MSIMEEPSIVSIMNELSLIDPDCTSYPINTYWTIDDEQNHGMARALTMEEQNEWRWYNDPNLTAAELRRAECDRQPLLLAGFVDETGRRRRRPRRWQDPDRARSDYDGLIETRAYSPNGRVVGFDDLTPEDVERENAFTPMQDDVDSPRSPSPGPAPGSREAMMSGALAEPRYSSPGLPRVSDYHHRSNAGVRRHEVADFASRFVALPAELQEAVIVLQHQQDLLWMDALVRIESTVWLFNLTPEKRRIALTVQRLHSTVKDDYLAEVRIYQRLLARFCTGLNAVDLAIRTEEVLMFLFHDFRTTGQTRGRNNEGNMSSGLEWWLDAIDAIDDSNLEQASDETINLRQTALECFLTNGRMIKFHTMCNFWSEWLATVGDLNREAEGIFRTGDFWVIPQGNIDSTGAWTTSLEWKKLLQRAEDSFCMLSTEDMQTVTTGELVETMDECESQLIESGLECD
ncbi:hypothetical protein LTR37_001523 [Vermiconidia calcicola]|uniref:Uncharacterized protein n=1 Tax=Vermiconidia calcicola TaxID=1690605 RepID=A0ACC3NW01_9PEZI|nr:hypothetical protein LTR37_001523 [Vermiconidia calcicola]